MSNFILHNRIYNILENNWYAPMKWLSHFISISRIEFVDTTSSAGDWMGFFVQKVGKNLHFIRFWQENNYPKGGFTLSTDTGSFFIIESKEYNDLIRDDEFINYIHHICMNDDKNIIK